MMLIRAFKNEDMDQCVKLLMEAYNCEPWNNNWSDITAGRYLNEFAAGKNFAGFVICEEEKVIGAMFAHRKTWWTNDELFVDEIYIKPQEQRKGHGNALLKYAEEYAQSQGLAGLTLLTNRYFPSRLFYEKNGYTCAEHVIFMYKEL
jgi:aminoglycoside 6'-N-acetyltransferase I